MSTIEVTSLESNALSVNSIAAGPTTVNSTGIYLSGSNGVINTSSVKVTSGVGDATLQPTISTTSITIGGASYSSIPTETVNTQIFTANGTWIKPAWANTGNELVIVHMWGGGSGGSASVSNNAGGGGGAFVFGYYKASLITGSSVAVTVGLGGGNEQAGGNSIFSATNAILTSYGGGNAGQFTAGVPRGGGGGGWVSRSLSFDGGAPLGGNAIATVDSTFGGGAGGWTSGSGRSIYGGGGGNQSWSLVESKGDSIYGGGGGSQFSPVGQSIYGGSGANSTVAATAPGGGGAGGSNNTTGARGEVRVYTLRITG